ncbi:agmatinase [Halovenus sp. WSH3]|uniref:Agmatinase n=1 Tax=Halovenus carboxidivorans TaxID=2692199 RepID=A0A6B0TA57_9EURY|nr:agmatinase family protein [Halovenus carboxidivorans]MXR52121.1 agmatinase [Halovenus carboxidivorans]
MFPGAVADRDEGSFAVVGAPLDASTSFRPGTRFGPRELRHAAHPFEDYDQSTDSCFTDCAVYDHGDIHPTDDVSEYLDFLSGTLAELAGEGLTPLVLGGEHTVTIAALRALDPDVYVCLDAHLDLRESYAGNPLSHATVTHHALDIVDEAIILGARSGSKAEYERAEVADVTLVEPADVPSWEFDRSGDLYLSVDIDAADPGFAPGTGTPEPFGLEPPTMHDVVRTVAPEAVGFDVVEVNDRDDGQTAALGAKLLRAFVYENGQ